MAPTGEAYNIDWITSTASNVHLANHREWFTSFTDFKTAVNGGSMEVLGIGDVTLPVQTHPDKTGAAAQGTIVLRDVCYAPSAVCNIIGMNIVDDGYNVKLRFGGGDSAITDLKTGARVGIFDKVKFMRLRLQGQSPTTTSLDKNTMYMIGAQMSQKEQTRWQAYKKQMAETGDAPYTAEEKRWLKECWENEFHFMAQYGLSIYKDEDRIEGRRIARAMMKPSVRR